MFGACLLALGLTACGDDGGGVQCGEGTVEKDGECVVETPDGGEPDSGKEPDPGAKDSGPGKDPDPAKLTCGDGTIESGGKCVVDPDKKLDCGPGTFAKDGKCEVSPPPPPNIEKLRVTQLSIKNRGELVGDQGEIMQYYPIDVSVGLTYKGDKSTIPVVFALGEPPNPNKTADEQKDLGFCLVGGFDVEHPGGTDATETIVSKTLYIPKGCLPATENTHKYSPIIMIDPDRKVGAKDQNTVTRRVAFMKQNDVDEDMKACRIDAISGSTPGTCQVEVNVNASEGLDFELAELTAESSVVVLDKCASDLEPDRPASYKCNSAIVPEFEIKRKNDGTPELDNEGQTQIKLDGDGKPIQATYDDNGTAKPKWVYGAADLALDLTVITHGEDDSKLNSADQAMTIGGDDQKAVNNVLADHGLQIKYEIRPTDAADDTWKPLYLHKQGEQAKAGEEGESGQDQEQFEETQAVPATPSYYSHGLYVENDCGERNTGTCNNTVNPRTDIISGTWAGKTNFTVRACLVPVDDNGAQVPTFDDNNNNNCRELAIKVVRRDTTSSTATAASYGFNYQWGDGAGSQSTLRLSYGFHTWNKVDTAGVTVDNEGALTIGSNLIGYTDILKGWAKGAAYVSLVGSYYDYGISTFGIKLWGDAKIVPEYHWEKDWNVSKDLRKGTIVWAGPVPINLEIRFAGTAGIVVNLDIIGVKFRNDDGTDISPAWTDDEESETFLKSKITAQTRRIGLAQLTITPYGKMTVTASASLSAVVVRAGVAGELTLMDMTVPLTGRLWWGLTSISPVNLRLGAWADLKLKLTVMSGRIYLFAENYNVNWCSYSVDFGWWSSTVWYPCGASWNRFWDFTIASWSGWTWNQTLWASPYIEYNIP